MRNAQNIRMHSYATTFASSLPRLHSEWASINQTCVLLCITTCRKILKAITRKPDAPDATDYPANAYCFSVPAMLQAVAFHRRKNREGGAYRPCTASADGPLRGDARMPPCDTSRLFRGNICSPA